MKKLPKTIVYDDGTSAPATEAELTRALDQIRSAAPKGALEKIRSDALRMLEETGLANAVVGVRMHEIASELRKPEVTKEKIIAFRDKWRKGGRREDRGWKAAACREFRIDRKTLDDRLIEE
jgi:hypothetical protein